MKKKIRRKIIKIIKIIKSSISPEPYVRDPTKCVFCGRTLNEDGECGYQHDGWTDD